MKNHVRTKNRLWALLLVALMLLMATPAIAATGVMPGNVDSASGELFGGIRLVPLEEVQPHGGDHIFVCEWCWSGCPNCDMELTGLDCFCPYCPNGIYPEPVISPVADGRYRVPYTAQLRLFSGPGEWTASWRITSGSLPPGLAMATNGRITGTPTRMGAFSFTVRADSVVGSATRQLSIRINPTITWNANGGTVSPTVWSRTPGEQLGTLPIPIRAGHGFMGWFTQQTGGTQIAATTQTPAVDTTYWARWGAVTLTVDRTAWASPQTASGVIVNVTSNAQWSVDRSDTSWLTISNITPMDRTGNGSFRLGTAANMGEHSRTGTVTITSGNITRTITVTQAPATFTMSQSAWNPTPLASNTTINVTANIQWNMPTSNVNWLTITNVSPTNRTGNGSFRINATANTGTASRTGTVTITGGNITRTITVTQAAPSLTVSQSTWNASAAGGNTTIHVTSNIQWSTPTRDVTWLTINNIAPTNRTGNGSFQITAAANTGMNSRIGRVTVTGGGYTRAITVTQTPMLPAAPVIQEPTNITSSSARLNWNTVPNIDRYRVYRMNGNIPMHVGNRWQTYIDVSGLAANTEHRFRIVAECDSRGRSAPSYVTFRTLAPPPTPVMQTPTADASSVTLRWHPVYPADRYRVYRMNGNTPIHVGNRWQTYIIVTGLAPDTNHTFRVIAECDRRGRSPHAEIQVRTLPATLTVSQSTWAPGHGAGNMTVQVTSNITWTPTSNVGWLTINNIAPANRTGNGSFRINAVANPGTGNRTGAITVTGGGLTRTISVTQAGAPANVTITWNANGTSRNPDPWFRPPGTTMGTLPTWTRAEHTFVGWFNTPANVGGTRITPSTTVPSSNMTYWARWADWTRHNILWWPSRSISFRYENVPLGSPWREAMERGRNNWNASAAPVSFNVNSNSVNQVRLANHTWEGFGRFNAHPERGSSGPTMTSFVITLNSRNIPNFNWATSTMAHELGHAVGLADGLRNAPLGGGANNSLMNHERNRNIVLTPQPFDIESVRILYDGF